MTVPSQLMKVLSDPKFAHIIEWLPSGKSFVIHKPKVFATDVLPTHFKSAKYSSFTRKLHRWGFVRHFRGGESGAFFHDDFQKGRLDLAEAMTCCQQQKEAASKTARKARQKVMHEHSPARNALRQDLRPSQAGHSFPVLQQPHSHTLESMMHPPFASSASALDRINGFSGLSSSASSASGLLSGLRQSSGLRPPMMDSAFQAAVLEQQILKERYDVAIQEELTRLEYSRLAKERLQDLQRARLMQQQQLSQQLGRASGAMGVLPSSSSSMGWSPASLAPVLSQLSRAELERYALAMASRQGNTGGGGGNLLLSPSSSSPRGAASSLPYDPLRNGRPNPSSFLPP
jgi:HSF-type DNA-binding